MKNQKGFSLVELLVVVIIIAIIAAIAIPSLLASRRAANEASAISSLRTIHSAQATYQATYGSNTDYASTLTELGPPVAPAPPSAAAAGLIDGTLAAATGAGSKSGYSFTLSVDAAEDNYCTSAAPTSASTGTRSFGVSTTGVVVEGAAAATVTCALGVLAGGTAIQ